MIDFELGLIFGVLITITVLFALIVIHLGEIRDNIKQIADNTKFAKLIESAEEDLNK